MNGSANQAKYQTNTSSTSFQPIEQHQIQTSTNSNNSRIVTTIITNNLKNDSTHDITGGGGGPPQPPQRNHLRSSLIRNNNNSTIQSQSPSIQSVTTIVDNNNKNNATHEVAKLVYKTVGTGSVQNLLNSTSPVESNQIIQNNRNLSIPEKSILANHHYSGAISNKESRDELRKDLAVDKEITRKNSASPQYLSSNRNQVTNINSSPVQFNNNNNNTHSYLPWILISGEFLVIGRDKDSSEIPILFVLPDNRAVNGKLYITNFRIFFKSNDLYQMSVDQPNFITIDLPLGLINRVEKIGHQSSKHTNFYGFLITCKNGRRLRFAHNNDRNTRREIFDILQKYAFPKSNQIDLFTFSYCKIFQENGWHIYDIYQEYERMGISQSKDWRFSKINFDFKFCETYPKVLVVPNSSLVSDDDLRQVGEFRSKHRIPIVSWIKYDSKTFRAALLRCSQPLVGLKQKRNDLDEAYLNTIFKMNTNNSTNKLFIVDARPLKNAVANRAVGGGYEIEDHYENCEILFLNIQNIHVMRESLRKVFEMAMPSQHAAVVNGLQPQSSANNLTSANSANNNNNNNLQTNLNDDKNYLVNLENSKWLEHIRLVLNGALKIVRYISQHRASVLVHCSDGWDRTSQLTALSMLMMDKYYRTIRGFQVLIEKEWLSFGHRFGIRMGHGLDKHSDQDRSPIFLQFIDACWQVLKQNGKVFEFNEKFLLAIVQNMYTNQFGTFLFNNEYEREKHEAKTKTVSLWSYINSNINEFKNNSYVEYDGVVEFSSNFASLQLWTSYYFQYKETIDDNINEHVITNYNQINQLSYNVSTHPIASTANLANPAAKINVHSFFQNVVNQMKSSVRSNNSAQQEPELIRYRATVQSSEQ